MVSQVDANLTSEMAMDRIVKGQVLARIKPKSESYISLKFGVNN